MAICGPDLENRPGILKPDNEDYNKTTESICSKIDKLTERVNKLTELVEKLNNPTVDIKDITFLNSCAYCRKI